MDPGEHVSPVGLDPGRARRIGPGVVDLAPEAEVAPGGPPTEEIGSVGEMRLEQPEGVAEGLFDLRRRDLVRADEADPRLHALDHLRPHGDPGVLVPGRRHRHGDPTAGREAILFARPAQMEHPLVAPLVAELFE